MLLGLELVFGSAPTQPPAVGTHPAVPACVIGGSEFVLITQATVKTEMVAHNAAAAAAKSLENL